jgi:hypothetical protein
VWAIVSLSQNEFRQSAQPNTGNNGQSLAGHLLNVSYHGPDWLTGGPRGPEASALQFLVLAFMFLAFARAYPSARSWTRGTRLGAIPASLGL